MQVAAFKPRVLGSDKIPQNPASLGSDGIHCSKLFVNGDISSQHQYDTLIFRRPTHGVKVSLDMLCDDCIILSCLRTNSTFFWVVREAKKALWFLQDNLALS